jgi:hypothetical protein
LVVTNKGNGLEVNTDKTKNMVMSGDQNAGQSHNMSIDNSSLERVAEFKYLETQMKQNSNREEIKCRLNSENACYRSVQNLISSSLLSTNTKIRICRNIILPVVLYEC